MNITKQTVADKIAAYLRHDITQAQLVEMGSVLDLAYGSARSRTDPRTIWSVCFRVFPWVHRGASVECRVSREILRNECAYSSAFIGGGNQGMRAEG